MTRKELKQVLEVLEKIKPYNPHVEEAKCSVKRDIERRKQQSDAQKENFKGSFYGDFDI